MRSSRRGFSFINCLVFTAAVSLGLQAFGQFQVNPRPTGGDDQSSHDDKATPPGVSVADSPGAAERLSKGAEKENQKQWKTAAEYYQEAMAKYPARVVPVQRDSEKGIYQYAGVALVVQERLSKWPEEGLKVYRQQYGQTAADLLTAARTGGGDTGALRNIFWNYFITEAGKTAGMQLLDGYLETGDFQAAAWIGDRLLRLYPGLGADRSMIQYRTALAFYWSGNASDAKRLLAALKQSNAGDVGTIGGKDTVLADSLTSILASPAIKPTTLPTDADTYPSFGGLGGRGDISSSIAKPGASLTSIKLTPPDINGQVGTARKQFTDADENSLASNGAMGIIPAADAGSLFFQDGRCMYAVDLDTGAPLPGWFSTYGGERAGRYKLNVQGRARNELLTITVTPSAVLAIMGQPDRNLQSNANVNFQFIQQNVANPTPLKLVCLDRDTGRENWIATPAGLPDSIAVLRNGDYCGTPLVVPAAAGRGVNSTAEDSVLVVARGGKENQFDDCYVVCLSLKTGQFRWSTYVGSATRNFDLDGNTASQPSQMALADGRVFVMTNLGTVAALDPSDGRVIWLDSYARDEVENPMQFRGFRRMNQVPNAMPSAGKPWCHNPVIVNDGHVFILPSDAKKLLVYDAGSGAQQQSLPMASFNNAEVMLGLCDGAVCLTSDKDLYVVDWKKYAEDHGVQSCIRWERLGLTDSGERAQNSICGRGFITADSIFIPSNERIYQMSMKRMGIQQVYPRHGTFTGTQGPGNVLVTANNVVVAGQTQVDVYTNLDLVRQRFEAAMAAKPTDPAPRIQYAEALFSGGQSKDAVARSDEAINLIGGINAMRSGPDRAMIFNRMLDFARRSVAGADKAASPEIVAMTNAFFDRAGSAAESALEKANYRLERAKFDHLIGDYTSEVKLCQEVLSDNAMRNSTLENDVPAANSAETAIEVAYSLDHSVYHAIEQQAQDALKAARDAGDPMQMLAVATVYPNSKAAVDARQEAVNRFEAANQPDKAIDVLRRIYTGTIDPVDRANVLVSITNDYLGSAEGFGPAIDRLCRAARLAQTTRVSQKIRLPDGTTLSDVTYAQAITTLRQLQADQDSAALPDFHFALANSRFVTTPFIKGQAPIISNVTVLVHPLRDFARNDQILTWSTDGLCIYPAGQTVPIATIAAVDKPPLRAAWVHGNWMVWTKDKVLAISGDGKVTWEFTTASLPTLVVSSGRSTAVNDAGDPAAEDAANVNQPGMARVVRVNGQLIQVPPGAGVNIRGLQRGNLGQVNPQPPVQMPVHSGSEDIVDLQPAGPAGAQLLISTTAGRVLAIDARNGQVIWQNRPQDHAVDQLLANAHFTVVRMDDPGGSEIAVFDSPSGHVIGRRLYGPDNSLRQLINVGLSEDATLAVTVGSQVLVKDLYDPWKPNFTELSAQTNRDTASFIGLNRSDQLLIKGGRLACVYGSGEYARGYDLSRSADPTNPLTTRADSPDVSLRMVGPRLFIVTSNRIFQYNLSDPGFYPGGSGRADAYEGLADSVTSAKFVPKVRGLLLGKDYAVSINDSVDRGPLGSPLVALLACRRGLVPHSTRESGEVDYAEEIRSDAGVTDWTSSDGAIYYLTRDNNLHVLRGARP